MFGVILVSIGTFFEEVSDSIGKIKNSKHKEGPYTMAFLSLFWGFVIFTIICLINTDLFIFKAASLPTFLIRAVLEIVQLYVSIFAIIKADRSTFSFIRTITIPLLLITDVILGYSIGAWAILGIILITIALFAAFVNNGVKKAGLGWVIFSALNAVLTISLYKYNISHFNSVVAEQFLINLILLIFFTSVAFIKTKENPFIFLTKPIFLLQSAAVGIAGAVESFAYGFGAASIIAAAKRSSSIFWSILSGKTYFKERHLILKLYIFSLLLLGLIFLSFNS